MSRETTRRLPRLLLRFLGLSTLVAVLMLTLTPVVALLAASLSSSGRVAFPFDRLTLEGFSGLFSQQQLRWGLGVSAVTGALTATLTLAIAFLAARRTHRRRRIVGDWYDLVLVLPFACPLVALGIIQLALFSALHVPRSIATVVIGQTSYVLPLIAIVLAQGFTDIVPNSGKAARNLGAPPLDVLVDITVPQLRRALISGWFLAFAVSWQDHVLSWFLSGFNQPLAAVLYSRTGGVLGSDTFAAGVLSWVVFSLAVLGVFCYTQLSPRR